MIISFGWTADLLPPKGTKDTTRRIWKPRTLASWQKAWDEKRWVHTATDKNMAYGGKRIGTITLIERPYLEPLYMMPVEDLVREGGTCSTVPGFIDAYFNGNGDQEVAVVRFKFHPWESEE